MNSDETARKNGGFFIDAMISFANGKTISLKKLISLI